jgi:SAM-dependent methyltransferase
MGKNQPKNSTEMYGEEYLKSPISMTDPKITRWEDNGFFFQAGKNIAEIAQKLKATKVVDIGCGRGFTVRHLRNRGLDAHGIEYSKFAVEHSVCGAKHGDLTESLPAADGEYDLAVCVGVLSHIPEEFTIKALKQIHRIVKPKGHLYTNILIIPAKPSTVMPSVAVQKADKKKLWTQKHHLSIHQQLWWRNRFHKTGWDEEKELEQLLTTMGMNRSGEQWSTIWERIGK